MAHNLPERPAQSKPAPTPGRHHKARDKRATIQHAIATQLNRAGDQRQVWCAKKTKVLSHFPLRGGAIPLGHAHCIIKLPATIGPPRFILALIALGKPEIGRHWRQCGSGIKELIAQALGFTGTEHRQLPRLRIAPAGHFFALWKRCARPARA